MATILLAASDRDVRDLVELYLSSTGHAVHAVREGDTACAVLRGMVPDLLLLERSLLGIDAFEVVARCRQHPAQATLPVVMLSGMARADEVAFALRAGVDRYVPMPFGLHDLGVTIADLLQRDLTSTGAV